MIRLFLATTILLQGYQVGISQSKLVYPIKNIKLGLGEQIQPIIPQIPSGIIPLHKGSVTTIAGNGCTNGKVVDVQDGPNTVANFLMPFGVTMDKQGNLLVADESHSVIRKIDKENIVSTIGKRLSVSDFSNLYQNGALHKATFNFPSGIAVDSIGDLYIADKGNHCIRKITQQGQVLTIAGTNKSGFVDGAAAEARFNNPTALAIGVDGCIYVADQLNHSIRKINSAGIVSTLAGNGKQGKTNGVGKNASFSFPAGVIVDKSNHVFVADERNNCIRKITPDGVVNTFAGSGERGFADGNATQAKFNGLCGITIDKYGNLFVGDNQNSKIRRIDIEGNVSTFAGSGAFGFLDGDGGVAKFINPCGVYADNNNNIYIADLGNCRIRKMSYKGAFSITPQLPEGLLFDSLSGIISGTPSEISQKQDYTIQMKDKDNVLHECTIKLHVK